MNNRPSAKSRHLLGHRQRGFSLLELMFALSVLAILLGLSVPPFVSVIRNNRVISQNNEFIGALNYARSEAVRRNESVTLCSSTNGTGCSTTTVWGTGWITFVDLNANGTLDGAEVVMQVSPPVISGFTLDSTTGSLNNVRFQGNGMLGNAAGGSFRLQKTGCSGLYARTTSVDVRGRVSTVKSACV